jgi:pyrroline-5-carboxylate reductase
MTVAGVTVASLTAALPAAKRASIRVARAMPNTPALIGAGASAFVLSKAVSAGSDDTDRSVVRAILGCVGSAYEVADEKLLDAVTGLSGSGPAYVFLMIEALSDG